jgi:hypothetical protein
MDWSEGMELVHKPVWDVLVLGPELITQGFCHPGGEHQGSEDELRVVRELDAEGPMSHEPARWVFDELKWILVYE